MRWLAVLLGLALAWLAFTMSPLWSLYDLAQAVQQRGGDRLLGGTRGDGAYYLVVTPAGAGSAVSLIVTRGS